MKKKIMIPICITIIFIITITSYCLKDNLSINVLGTTYSYKTLKISDLSYDLRNTHPVFDTNSDLNTYVTYNVDINSILHTNFLKRLNYAFSKKKIDIPYTVNFNKDKIESELDRMNLDANWSQNAFITKDTDSNKWILVSEINGDFINVDNLLNDLNSNTKSIKIAKYYDKPDVTKDDLKDIYKQISKYQTWSCTYTNGEVITAPSDAINYDSSTNEVSVDDNWITSKIVKNALKSYDTVGTERDFTTHDGNNIKISGGTWGSKPDIDKEIEYLKENFNKGESITDRTPEYSYNYEDFLNTYIELSIEKQHLWVYQDGNMIMETDVVTGDCTKKRDTPTGCYFISEHINGKYLTGENYKTWVNKWMRLTNQGVGLHDASWQSYFGGNRYKGHGSHGCINLPPKFASDLFDIVSVGWLVVIY